MDRRSGLDATAMPVVRVPSPRPHAAPVNHRLRAGLAPAGSVTRSLATLLRMRERAFQPRRLDVQAFASDRARQHGQTPLAALSRLRAGVLGPADPGPAEADVRWELEGLWRERAGSPPEIRLRLRAHARVSLGCQRCLQPMAHRLDVDTTCRFVRGEALAVRLDEEGEEDVLALTRAFDLLEWLEDELLLALPLVPRHADCTMPAHRQGPVDAGPTSPTTAPGKVRPLAALRDLIDQAPDPAGTTMPVAQDGQGPAAATRDRQRSFPRGRKASG